MEIKVRIHVLPSSSRLPLSERPTLKSKKSNKRTGTSVVIKRVLFSCKTAVIDSFKINWKSVCDIFYH